MSHSWTDIERGVRRASEALLFSEVEAESVLKGLLEGRLRAVTGAYGATLVVGTIPEVEGGERIHAAAGRNQGTARRIASLFAETTTRMVDFFTPHRAMPRLARRAVRGLDVDVEVQPIWHVVVRRR